MNRDIDALKDIERQISLLIRRADITKAADNMSLDRSAYLLIAQLMENGPQAISTLANTLLLDISTVSRQIAALEKKQLVVRLSEFESGRMSLLQVTELGKERYFTMRERRVKRYQEILADWPVEAKETLRDNLSRLNEAIEIRTKRWFEETKGGKDTSQNR